MGYAANGARQRGTGQIPQVILAQTIEITRDEAQTFVAAWQERADALRQQVTDGSVPTQATQADAASHPVMRAPDAPAAAPVASAAPAPRRSRRLVSVSVSAAVLVVAIALVVLAFTGNLGMDALGCAGNEDPANDVTTQNTATAADDVLATVGGQPITQREFDQKIADFQAQYAAQIPDEQTVPDEYRAFEQGVLDYLITYRIVSLKAGALGITVTDQDIESELALILSSTYGGDQAEFEAAVTEQGLTSEQFERIYGESLLFNRVYAEVTKGVTVPGDDTAELETRQKQFWSDWLSQQKQTVGVTYSERWAAPADPSTTVS